ncbi:T9SS type B sorting domain-containing protein [Lacibacter sediminis]|uniref:Gliding motility-associated C-terminal domain-containing protein n=1 Tax=Lacibacter sediminis TaxID=2760713 RepID=A0A7G5XH37_9BACT|nr:T9SS type B sorting domain-containing protein [Lacibacter sediminis]QNA44790.1 gliding motility-associated C-terminal domain-containing protein [Lacibacter sediminis]
MPVRFFCFTLFFLQFTLAFAQTNESRLPASFISERSKTQNSFFSNTNSKVKSPTRLKQEIQRISFKDTDTCQTFTYKEKIGINGNNEDVNCSAAIGNGDIVFGGSVQKNGTAETDAYLFCLNAGGDIKWAKTVGTAGSNETIVKMKKTSDGNFIVIGNSKNLSTNKTDVLVLFMNATGILLWSRLLNDVTAGNLFAADVDETPNGNFLIAADNGLLVTYCSVSASGTVNWARKLQISATVKCIAVQNQSNYKYYIVSTGTDSGYKVGNVVCINPTSGIVEWQKKLGGPAQGKHVIFKQAASFNSAPLVIGLVSSNGADYALFRSWVTGWSPNMFEVYNTNSSLSPSASLATAMWNDFIFYSPSGSSQEWNWIKNGPESSVKSHLSFSIGFSSVTTNITAGEKTVDGGFLAAGTINDGTNGSKVFVVKTDSTGMMPLCPLSKAAIAKKDSLYSLPLLPAVQTNITVGFSAVSLAVADYAAMVTTSCKQIYCPPQIQEDTCLPTFVKQYRSTTYNDVAISLSTVQDSVVILSGVTDNSGMLLRLDKNGRLQLRRKFGFTENGTTIFGSTVLEHITAKDGNIAVLTSNRGPLSTVLFALTKYDPQFNQVSSKSYTMVPGYNYSGMCEDASSNIYLLFYRATGFNTDASVVKLDNTGNIVWIKSFIPTGHQYYIFWNGAPFTIGNDLFIGINYNYDNNWKFMLTKFNTANGSITWAKEYAQASKDLNLTIAGFNNGKLYFNGNASVRNGASFPFALTSDVNGTVLTSKRFALNSSEQITGGAFVARNGDLVYNVHYRDYINYPNKVFKAFWRLDPNLNVKLSKKTQRFGGFGYTYQAAEATDGSIYEIGINYSQADYEADFYLEKKLPDGSSGTCLSEPLPLSLVDEAVTVSNITLSDINLFALTPVTQPVPLQPLSINQNGIYCVSQPSCQSIAVNGPTQICDTAQNQSFKFIRSAGCTLIPMWSFDSSHYRLIQQTDSTLTVRFTKPGNFKLNVELFNGCSVYKDSMMVQVIASPALLNLGADKVLCKDSLIRLNASAGFQSYLWQNGSTDSTFIVDGPGTYHVAVTDNCNNIFRDTVVVTGDASSLFKIEAGTFVKCNNDSLLISAVAGFERYNWYPQSDLKQISSASVQVYPKTSRIYTVKAFTPNACPVLDSVLITVNTSPTIKLGNDTAFCKGNSVVFDAGNGFVSYAWSNGMNTKQITVNAAANYFVKATAANGCSSFDTVRITNVFANPLLQLGGDTSFCIGSSIILSPGVYSNYSWQDGSNASSIRISSPGLYWVKVKDSNGCNAADSIKVLPLKQLPQNFLADTISFCPGSSVQLEALQNYAGYLWSNGGRTNRINVTQPGNYWLEATNNDGCKNRDTIDVKYKDCVIDLNFPNGFTPNKDQLNDLFQPMVWGILETYRLRIYDRWGMLIFETTDPLTGWDGTYKGKPYDPGTFSWICIYQFKAPGSIVKRKSGLVHLLR